MSYDRETIGAFVDGELDEISRRRIETAVRNVPELARQVEAERRVRTALRARFDPIVEQPLPERLVAAVREGAKIQSIAPKRRHWMPLAVAASVVALAIAGLQLRPAPNPNLASGPLATALETQLASAQPADAAIRIGLTFKARDGAWCRTFDQREGSGIACRSNEHWEMRRLESENELGGNVQYRQATSAESAVAAQEMAAEPPLDAEGERKLVASGWSS
jgi:negative regulator of sigma E activity